MANKRSRTAYEAGLQEQRAVGTYDAASNSAKPQQLDENDTGKFVPAWLQDVRDEQGRRRFHGAFTGGYSAGYFNSVGSKDGWTPQNFKSSRTDRAVKQQRAEDYMDEEDLANIEEDKRVKIMSKYKEGAGADGGIAPRDALIGLVKKQGIKNPGTKLLQKMGWIPDERDKGPPSKRKQQSKELGVASLESEIELDLGSENSKLLQDQHSHGQETVEEEEDDSEGEEEDKRAGEISILAASRAIFNKVQSKQKKPSFGVGILNDTGSDDEDAYELGPKISLNPKFAGDKKTNRQPVGASDRLLAPKYVSKNKKKPSKLIGDAFRADHGAQLPENADGSTEKPIVRSHSSIVTTSTETANPIGRNHDSCRPAVIFEGQSEDPLSRVSSLPIAAESVSNKEPSQPAKSVFDFLSPAARDRLAAISGRSDLPAGKGESAPEDYKVSEEVKRMAILDMIPSLNKMVAVEALQRGANGWMPYADDEGKRSRYKAFLEIKAGIRDGLPEKARNFTKDDWRNEMDEFAQAAEVFRPMTGVMATRFTSSSQTYEGSKLPQNNEQDQGKALISKPAGKQDDPAEEAAKLGMYGPLTRSVVPFHPTKLVCKRFNVRPPDTVELDPGSGVGGMGEATSQVKEVLPRIAIERMMQDAAIRRLASTGSKDVKNTEQPGNTTQATAADGLTHSSSQPASAASERAAALETERLGDAVFQAIFGSDEDDD